MARKISASTPPPSPVPGDVLAERFVIEAAAGHGGLGVVFRGWDLEQDEPVAIKILTELTAIDVLRFRRETAVLAALGLPGVVRYIAHGETASGTPYLVMEWLEGETVAKKMEHPGFDVADAVALVRATCIPLAALHAGGLIHRDLKPDNLVMTSDEPGSVVLIDLGLARATARPEARVTATGVVMGTPGYMAPELIRGEPSVDARVDVFALGCVLYELATGFPPFAGENALAVRAKILLTSPPPLVVLCPEAPIALEHAVTAMIAKDRAQRPATAADVSALLAALGELPPGPRRTWNPTRPSTAQSLGVARPRRARAPARITTEPWTGVVLVEMSSVETSSAGSDTATAQLTYPGDRLHATVAPHGGELDVVEDGYLVVHLPTAPRLAELAPRLARTALGLCALMPGARIVVSAGRGPIELLIDDAALLLEHASRAALFDRDAPAGPGDFVFVDDITAEALVAHGFELEHRRWGYRLMSERP